MWIDLHVFQGPEWLDGSPYTYRRWLPPDPSLTQLTVHHKRQVLSGGNKAMRGGEYFPAKLRQYLTADVAHTVENNCTIAVSFNPYQMYWAAIPCHAKFTRYALICQTRKRKQVTGVSQPPGPCVTCLPGYIRVLSACMRLFPVTQDTRSNRSLVECESPSVLAVVSNDDSWAESAIASLLEMWSNDGELTFTARYNTGGCVTLTYDGLTLDYNHWQWNAVPCSALWRSDYILCSRETVVREPCSKKGLFACSDGSCILQTRLCDGFKDCPHGKDETDCRHACVQHGGKPLLPEACLQDCPLMACKCARDYYRCKGGGCVDYMRVCDGVSDCLDGDDEDTCPHPLTTSTCLHLHPNTTTTMLVSDHCSFWKAYYPNMTCDSKSYDVIQRGDRMVMMCADPNSTPCSPFNGHCYPRHKTCLLDLTPHGDLSYCPTGDHLALCTDMQCWDSYKCPQSYCLSWRLVCDGTEHCPHGEDEQGCEGFTYRGLLRCGQDVCVHPNQVSDGVFDCPDKGDESLCGAECPKQCECVKHTITCSDTQIDKPLNLWNIVKHLNLYKTSTILLTTLKYPEYLLDLEMISCGVTTQETLPIQSSVHLRFLNLSRNSIDHLLIPVFKSLRLLQVLDLSFNRISALNGSVFEFSPLLTYLSLEGNSLVALDQCLMSDTLYLDEINLGSNEIQYITREFFCEIQLIRVITLTDNPLQALQLLETTVLDFLYTDQRKVCCHLQEHQSCGAQSEESDFCIKAQSQTAIVPIMASLTAINLLFNIAAILWWVFKKKFSGYSFSVLSFLISGTLFSVDHMLMLSVRNSLQVASSFQLVSQSDNLQVVCALVATTGLVAQESTLASLAFLSIERVLLTKYALESKVKGSAVARWRMTSLLVIMWSIIVPLSVWVAFTHFRFNENTLLYLCTPYLPSLYTTIGSITVILLMVGFNASVAMVIVVSYTISTKAIHKCDTRGTWRLQTFCSVFGMSVLSNVTMVVMVAVLVLQDVGADEKPGENVVVYCLLVVHVTNAVLNTLGTTFLTSGFVRPNADRKK